MAKASTMVEEADDDEVIIELPTEPRPRLSANQQYLRNMEVVAKRMRRVPEHKVAEEHGITTRRVRQIFAEYRDQNPTLREHDPIEIVDQLLYGYEAVIVDLEKQASEAKQEAVRVGALNSKLRAMRDMAELLQAVGALPNDLGTMHLHIDGQITANRILTVLDRLGVNEEVYEQILEALGGPPPELLAQHAGD